jgi:hypothetical protein
MGGLYADRLSRYSLKIAQLSYMPSMAGLRTRRKKLSHEPPWFPVGTEIDPTASSLVTVFGKAI